MLTTRPPILDSLYVAGALALLQACAAARDPPAPDAPEYQTPGRFSPLPEGGPSGGPGFFGPGSNRPWHPGGLAAVLDETHVVAAVEGRGVLVYDVSDASAPRAAGELHIAGELLQFDLDAEGRRATLAVNERTKLDSDRVPAVNELSTLRLIEVDLGDVAAPARGAQIDLERDGTFWQFVHRDDRFVVLAELHEPAPAVCDPHAYLGPATRAMRVTSYTLAADGFNAQAAVELPADAAYAFVTEDAIFAVDHREPAGAPQALGFVDFSSGTLRAGAPFPIDGTLLDADRHGTTLIALLERDGARRLQTFRLSGTSAVEQGELALSADATSVTLLGDGARATITGERASLVDLSPLDTPRIARRFPADVSRVLAVNEGLLGLGASASPNPDQQPLVVTLFAADATEPRELGRLVTPWIVPYVDSIAVEIERAQLLVPTDQRRLGVVRWDADGVRVRGEQPSRADIGKPFSDGRRAYSLSAEGFEVLPLDAEAASGVPVSGFASLAEEPTLAELSAGGVDFALREQLDDARSVLYVVTPSDQLGMDPQRIALDRHADGLIAVGDRVLAIGLYGGCEPAASDCAEYRERGVSVIALDPEPHVVASISLEGALAAPEIPDVRAQNSWLGAIVGEDGKVALLAQQFLECVSQASCRALDVAATSEGGSAPGCNPQAQDCSMLPPAEHHVSGFTSTLALFVLDGVDGGTLRLKRAVQIAGSYTGPGEGDRPVDLGWQLLQHGADFAIVREEQVADARGGSIANEHGDPVLRFWLDRVVRHDDGTLEALPSVNTPGRAIAWRGDDVYSVEPSYRDDGEVLVRLHRSRIAGDGAFIDAGVDLGTGYLDARAVGDQLFVLLGPTDRCAADPLTQLFAVDLASDALAGGEPLVLPGSAWRFPFGPALESDGALIVSGGPSYWGHARVDIADPARPALLGYRDAAAP